MDEEANYGAMLVASAMGLNDKIAYHHGVAS
jgi:hypothetical protein